jgi:hypothetical protein
LVAGLPSFDGIEIEARFICLSAIVRRHLGALVAQHSHDFKLAAAQLCQSYGSGLSQAM